MSLNVESEGLTIGRHYTCNIVLTDARAGRMHALVRPDAFGLKLFVTGSNPVLVGARLVERWTDLTAGDLLKFPGETMRVFGPAAAPAVAVWLFERDGQLSRASKSSFSLGGGPQADLRVPGWPAVAARFTAAQGALLGSFTVPARVDDAPVVPGGMLSMRPGQRITIAGSTVSVFRELHGDVSATVAWVREPPADRIVLEPMRSGARLTLQYPDLSLGLAVPELAARLLEVLIRPPSGFQAGDLIPDDLVMGHVWPHSPRRDSAHLERLVTRVRQELADRGVNPLRLLDRPPAGGAMRLIVGPGTDVSHASR